MFWPASAELRDCRWSGFMLYLQQGKWAQRLHRLSWVGTWVRSIYLLHIVKLLFEASWREENQNKLLWSFKKNNEQSIQSLSAVELNIVLCHTECWFFWGKIQPTTPSPGFTGEIYGIVKRGHSCFFRQMKNKS